MSVKTIRIHGADLASCAWNVPMGTRRSTTGVSATPSTALGKPRTAALRPPASRALAPVPSWCSSAWARVCSSGCPGLRPGQPGPTPKPQHPAHGPAQQQHTRSHRLGGVGRGRRFGWQAWQALCRGTASAALRQIKDWWGVPRPAAWRTKRREGHSTKMARKSFTLVCVGPVTSKSPRASK